MESYIIKHKDFETRLKSRSGGAFTIVSDYVLSNGGVVYGCVLDEDLVARHHRAITFEERDKMRGSKYVQSSIGNVYFNVKDDLEKGKLVLFTGTSCQVKALLTFLKKEYANLITMDIVCHGTIDSRILSDYISYSEEKYGKKITNIDFRNKYKYGWHAHVETLYFDDGSEVDSKIYTNLFYSHCFQRTPCYRCPFKNLNRVSDITIGDAWGVDLDNPEFDDDNGVSLVLLNTPKGQSIFEDNKENYEFIKVNISNYMQEPFVDQINVPKYKNFLVNTYNKKGFKTMLKHYRIISFISSLKNRLIHKK